MCVVEDKKFNKTCTILWVVGTIVVILFYLGVWKLIELVGWAVKHLF